MNEPKTVINITINIDSHGLVQVDSETSEEEEDEPLRELAGGVGFMLPVTETEEIE